MPLLLEGLDEAKTTFGNGMSTATRRTTATPKMALASTTVKAISNKDPYKEVYFSALELLPNHGPSQVFCQCHNRCRCNHQIHADGDHKAKPR